MTETNEKCPGSAERTSPAAERMKMFELDGPSIAAVAGGLNPQPLPPGLSLRRDNVTRTSEDRPHLIK